MTEKQFIADNEYVMQDNQVWVVCGGEHSADVVATALNELIDEYEQLKQTNQKLYDKLQVTMSKLSLKHGEVSILNRENEELKKTIEVICKDYEDAHGMDIRNADWFTAW